MFAPNHKLKPTVMELTIGNVGKRGDTTPDRRATGGRESSDKPRSHDTSRIVWVKLMARLEGWAELVQNHDDRNVFRAWPDQLPVIHIYSLCRIPCHGVDGPRVVRFQSRPAPTRRIRP